jgi:hypothetical protein
MSLRPIGLTDGFRSPFAGMLSIDLGGRYAATPYDLSGLRAVHGLDYSAIRKTEQCH